METYEYEVKLRIRFPHKPLKRAIREALRDIEYQFTEYLCMNSSDEDYFMSFVPNAKLSLVKAPKGKEGK